jgi:hypothetical protein
MKMELSALPPKSEQDSNSYCTIIPESVGFRYSGGKKELYFNTAFGGCVDGIQTYAGRHADIVFISPALSRMKSFAPAILELLEKKKISYDRICVSEKGARCNEDFSPDDFRKETMEKVDHNMVNDFAVRKFKTCDSDSLKHRHLSQTVSADVIATHLHGKMRYEVHIDDVDMFPLYSDVNYHRSIPHDDTPESTSCLMSAPACGFNVKVPAKRGIGVFMNIVDKFRQSELGKYVKFWTGDQLETSFGKTDERTFTGMISYPIKSLELMRNLTEKEQLNFKESLDRLPVDLVVLEEFYDSVNGVLNEFREAGCDIEIGKLDTPIGTPDYKSIDMHEVFRK